MRTLTAAPIALTLLVVVCACGDDAGPEADAAPPSAVDAGLDAAQAPDGSFEPPYELPQSGTVVDLPTDGRNVANDVMPAGHDSGSWQYALFQSYGGGVLQPEYSEGGGYVFAGQGGHNAPPVFGAAIFDFTDGTWTYVPNANGFDENRQSDLGTDETTGFPYVEILAVDPSTPQMPVPGHTYTLMIAPPRAFVGGDRGSVIRVFGTAMTDHVWDSYQSHQIDLGTGLWTRAADNLASEAFTAGQLTDESAALDPVTGRIYVLGPWPNLDWLAYLDLADRTWKGTPSFEGPPEGDLWGRSIWIDGERRLLFVLADSGTPGAGALWGFDLEDLASGPVQIEVDGELPNATRQWHKYPSADGGDDAYYALRGRSAEPYDGANVPLAEQQALDRLAPPAADPLANPWTYELRPINGGIVGEYFTDPGSGATHMSRFFYVPSIRCFAWIPNGTGPVQLIRP